jgi:tritrans,polycis-undecaprenyl-diphosphate synthase [geranylgeranyl-diphosphate specific]
MRVMNLNIHKSILLLARKLTYNPIIYKIYEKTLWSQIRNKNKPEHIGVILDGNRRWASKHLLPPWIGHHHGADKVEDFLEWCFDLGVKTVTLYIFSTENFQRSGKEVSEIISLIKDKAEKMNSSAGQIFHEREVRIKAIGRVQLLPRKVQKMLKEIEEATKSYNNFYLNLAIAYGGRAEIIDATRKIVKEVEKGKLELNQINEETFEKYLYTAHLPKSDPDLIIRTSGEERLSGFFLWQGAYSELHFLDVFWPDFRRIDLWRSIRTYQSRKRRRGK